MRGSEKNFFCRKFRQRFFQFVHHFLIEIFLNGANIHGNNNGAVELLLSISGLKSQNVGPNGSINSLTDSCIHLPLEINRPIGGIINSGAADVEISGRDGTAETKDRNSGQKKNTFIFHGNFSLNVISGNDFYISNKKYRSVFHKIQSKKL